MNHFLNTWCESGAAVFWDMVGETALDDACLEAVKWVEIKE